MADCKFIYLGHCGFIFSITVAGKGILFPVDLKFVTVAYVINLNTLSYRKCMKYSQTMPNFDAYPCILCYLSSHFSTNVNVHVQLKFLFGAFT
jgi:hypothetical protein